VGVDKPFLIPLKVLLKIFFIFTNNHVWLIFFVYWLHLSNPSLSLLCRERGVATAKAG
jgi:hypothetical protein